MIALIPARSGSKRVPGKNIRRLGNVPLMAWTIRAAQRSGVFTDVWVSTDNVAYAQEASAWDADVIMRPKELATDTSSDIEWVKHALDTICAHPVTFAILRPTSPFRTAETIQRAYKEFLCGSADSLRAVEKVEQHPCKMWTVHGDRMLPLFSMWRGQPWHSMQMSALPTVYVQNASLEMAWTYVIDDFANISGYDIEPFFTNPLEGFDINTLTDWHIAEEIVKHGLVEVPK